MYLFKCQNWQQCFSTIFNFLRKKIIFSAIFEQKAEFLLYLATVFFVRNCAINVAAEKTTQIVIFLRKIWKVPLVITNY